MKSKDTTSPPPTPTWRFAYDAAGERVAAWQRASGALLDVTLFLRDEAGRVLSDWLLIPGVSFGPKRDYLYAGDRLAVQLDWSEGESPVRRFLAVDHLNSTRAIVDDNGIVEEIDYLPFGGFLTGGPQPSTAHLFTGHERDTAEFASNLDYMHARYFSPNLGRFLSPDPTRGDPTRPQTLNRYAYTSNNPLARVDPTGLNWFWINDKWEWHEGDTYSYEEGGQKRTITSSYTHLLEFQKSGTNEAGAQVGTLTLYDQDKVIASSLAFSGGNGFPSIPNGMFSIRLDLRGNADSSDALKANQEELKQFYGIQQIAPVIVDSSGRGRDARWEWGSIRAALNEPVGETRTQFLGNYLHGKTRPGDYTQGCMCERSEVILHLLLGLDPGSIPVVPVDVR